MVVTDEMATWFDRLESVYATLAGRDNGVDCLEKCFGPCCPRALPAVLAARFSHYPVAAGLLPFEMEYLQRETNVGRWAFGRRRVTLADGTNAEFELEVGYWDVAHPCPFLTRVRHCGAYAVRPLDCRSYPLVPVFHEGRALEFRLSQHCPQAHTLTAAYAEQLRAAWRAVDGHLSASWRAFYRGL